MGPDRLPDPLVTAIHFASILERLDLPYVVGGSVASSFHGEPRSTHDVDFVVELTPSRVSKLIDLLKPAYYVDQDTALAAVRSGTSFNAIHLETAVKVDVFTAGSDVFDLERIRHCERVQVGSASSQTLCLDTPEHTILRKLEWYRRGGEVSARQWQDVLGIMHTQGARLDRERMVAWSKRLGVMDLLQRATSEADATTS